MKVSIYIMTAFHGNPKGHGRSVSVMEYVGRQVHTREGAVSEGETRNALELRACVDAMKALNCRCEVDLFLDNAYIRNAVALGWLDAWKANGWKKAGGEEPANARLWKDFYLLSHAMHKVAVKGYDGKYRERLEALLSGGCGAGPGGM